MFKTIKVTLFLIISLISFNVCAHQAFGKSYKQIGNRILNLVAFNPKRAALVGGFSSAGVCYAYGSSQKRYDIRRLKTRSLGYGLMTSGAMAISTVSAPAGLLAVALGLDLVACSLEKPVSNQIQE